MCPLLFGVGGRGGDSLISGPLGLILAPSVTSCFPHLLSFFVGPLSYRELPLLFCVRPSVSVLVKPERGGRAVTRFASFVATIGHAAIR